MIELEKMATAAEKSATLSEFLDWLRSNQYVLAKYNERPQQLGDDDLLPVRIGNEQLLADFFGIDLKKVEEERSALLQQLKEEKR